MKHLRSVLVIGFVSVVMGLASGGVVSAAEVDNGTIALNGSKTGNLSDSSEVDKFTFTLSEPGMVSVDFTHANLTDARTGWYFTVMDTNLKTFTSDASMWKETKVSSASIGLPAGTYLIRVERKTASYNAANYGVKLNYTKSAAWEKEFNDKIAEATSLPLNSVINGSLMESSDVDYYKFTLSKAGKITADFTHANLTDARTGWYFTVMDIDMNTLTSDSSMWNETKVSSASIGLPAGTYYIKVERKTASSNNADYGLKVNYAESTAWEKELNEKVATATPLTLNSMMNGSLMTSSDVDYFKLTLSKASRVMVDFTHANLTDARTGWYFSILDFDLKTVASDSSMWNETKVSSAVTELPAGTYYIKVERKTASSNNADYGLRVTTAPDAVPSISLAKTGNNSLKATWTAPAGSAVDNYIVTLINAVGAKKTYTVSGTTLSYTFNGVYEGKYTVSVVAKNTVASSAAKNSAAVVLVINKVNSIHKFTDIDGSSHKDNIAWMYQYGVTGGTNSDGTLYSPKAKVTREQMATFLYRIAGSPVYTPTNAELTKLKDISASQHKNSIAWLVKEGVTSGTSATAYSPKQIVTREQMATFLYRIAGSPAYTPTNAELTKFKDITKSQHKNAIAWLVKNGITSGTSATTYGPTQKVTREQMATFMARLYKLLQSGKI